MDPTFCWPATTPSCGATLTAREHAVGARTGTGAPWSASSGLIADDNMGPVVNEHQYSVLLEDLAILLLRRVTTISWPWRAGHASSASIAPSTARGGALAMGGLAMRRGVVRWGDECCQHIDLFA